MVTRPEAWAKGQVTKQPSKHSALLPLYGINAIESPNDHLHAKREVRSRVAATRQVDRDPILRASPCRVAVLRAALLLLCCSAALLLLLLLTN